MSGPGSTSAHTCLVTTILMITEAGQRWPSMGRFGIQQGWRLAGVPIAMDGGPGSSLGDGRGWTMRPGDLLPSITVVGCRLDRGGAGCPGPLELRRSTGLRSWPSLAVRVSLSALVLEGLRHGSPLD